eukprot:gene26222-31678_t
MPSVHKQREEVARKQPFWVPLLSGAGAGAICSVLCAPLDVAKVRMQVAYTWNRLFTCMLLLQVQGSLGLHKYTGGVLQTLRTIYKEEGWRGSFRGVGPALITIPLFWGVYWPIYDHVKVYLRENEFFNDKFIDLAKISWIDRVVRGNAVDTTVTTSVAHADARYAQIFTHLVHIFSAICAGAMADIITNPFWVTRTRIQTLALHTEENLTASAYLPNYPRPSQDISTYQMMRHIHREEGVRAFYRGLTASFLGLSHVAIQFPLYEYLKKQARTYRQGEETFWDLLLASMTAKVIAATLTYPHEVLRARMQDVRGGGSQTGGRYPTLYNTFMHIYKQEGVWSLWSGLKVNLVRIAPATVATFLSYEYISRMLKGWVAI